METPERREQACQRVKDALKERRQVVLVVSAMGRKGQPYATDTLINLARGVHGDAPAREMDLLISCGEIISAVLMVQELQKRGIDALALTGGQAGIITDAAFGEAKIITVEPGRILRHLDEGKVVVVAGFQGMTASGDVTTLGRGGSDTTAAALGAALGAEYVEIYTDVEGIMTADPRVVKDAKTIPLATYDEVTQMAWEGAKVIHPRAVEIAHKAKLPVWIRSMDKDSKKTLLTSGAKNDNPWLYWANGRPVTGVTFREGLVQIVVRLTPGQEMETTVKAFEALKGIALDLINVSPDRLSVAVDRKEASYTVKLLESLNLPAEAFPNKAKVTAIGYGMGGKPGVMDKMIGALWGEKIHVYASSDSDTTLSCLIDEEFLTRAVNAIHRAFEL